MDKQIQRISETYQRFALLEAAGRSPIYQAWAERVAASNTILNFLAQLPPDKQQPNLLFASLRSVARQPPSAGDFEETLMAERDQVRVFILSHSTQTNEPGRCAALLPALKHIEGPVALIEVGASAGLCLLPDKYGYDWGRSRLAAPTSDAPVFPCAVAGNPPFPHRHPPHHLAGRSGPVAAKRSNDKDLDWLLNLVWPEDTEGRNRLTAAIRLARKYQPKIHHGDLRHDLMDLINQAPDHATCVVWHGAVLTYVAHQSDRNAFAKQMLASKAVWISNESPRVFPQFSKKAAPPARGLFALTINGRLRGWTGPHGQSLYWL